MESLKHITKDEYYEWLKSADKIDAEYPAFTSCGGPHEFVTSIHKDGMLYSLCFGWYPEKDTDPNAKYKFKTIYWWGIQKLYKEPGQEGEGI